MIGMRGEWYDARTGEGGSAPYSGPPTTWNYFCYFTENTASNLRADSLRHQLLEKAGMDRAAILSGAEDAPTPHKQGEMRWHVGCCPFR